MKVLLIGPYPPPHGGVSVHVYETRRQLQLSGIECQVVNVDPRAPESDDYISIRGGVDLFRTLLSYARKGWILHVHTNGHNRKSWLVAFAAGLAGLPGPGCLLTLHSGMAPAYLAHGPFGTRLLARLVCSLYRRVIAVAPEVRTAVISLGVPATRVELLPAFIFTTPSRAEIPELQLVEGRRPLLASTLFFRREYGFELLVEAMDRLRAEHPQIACLVMGSGERRAEADRLVTERGLEDCIWLLGNIPHQSCISVMSRCDLLVRPALADGDANSVREALSLGIPVVASDVGHRPEGTVLFRTGDLDDLVSKIEETWSRPHLPPAGNTGSFMSLLDIYGLMGGSLEGARLTAPRKEQWEN